MRQTFGSITKNGLTQGYKIFIFEPDDLVKITPCKENKNMSREIIAQELAKINAPVFEINKYADLRFIGSIMPESASFKTVVDIYDSIDKNKIIEIKNRIDAIEPHIAQVRNEISTLVTPILNRAEYEHNTQQQ